METLVGAESKVSLAREAMLERLGLLFVVSAVEFVSFRASTTATATPIANDMKKLQEIIIRGS